MQLPLGAVIDWYRVDASIPVPEGFAIADGSAVTDAESPFFGLSTPDLSGRFVKGVTTTGAIGALGGSATVDLSHDHTHNHTHSGATNSSINGPFWYVPPSPVTPWRSSQVNHNHSFTTNFLNNSSTQNGLTSPVAIEPPYFGLLKLMRIK